MSVREPTRLTDQPGTGDELRRALEALGQEGADAERLARVAGKLGALLDAPPPPLPLTSRVLRLLGKKASLAKLAALPLLLGGALWLMQRPEQASVRPPPVPHEAPSVVEPGAAPSVEPLPQAVEAPAAPPLVAPPDAVEASRPVSVPRRITPRSPGASAPAALPIDVAPGGPAQPLETQASAPPTPESPAAPPPEPPPERPRRRSEAELLFEARKSLADQPAAALALLEQHAQLYPRGLLAPEREVLAIQALQRLGDRRAAEQRTRRFKAEHPDSFHLQQLE